MKPRFSSDYRLLFWMFVLLPVVPLVALLEPALAPYMIPMGLYLAYCTGIASHNHNHCPVFHSKAMNEAYAMWLSVFYGYPTFGWIPTHNQNHHKFTNGPGDETRTGRYAPRNTWWYAVTYPIASIGYQGPAIRAYIQHALRHRPRVFRQIVGQYLAVVLGHGAYLVAAVWLHGWLLGSVTYLCAMGVPAGFAIWSVMFTNFLQHVDCDPASPDDHSRNFVGRRTNWLLFNAGYHTVHHENPGAHWSKLAALHAQRAGAIDPELNPATLFGYCASTYLLGRERRPKSAPSEQTQSGVLACQAHPMA
jgi:beta-carotene hydroxylase